MHSRNIKYHPETELFYRIPAGASSGTVYVSFRLPLPGKLGNVSEQKYPRRIYIGTLWRLRAMS